MVIAQALDDHASGTGIHPFLSRFPVASSNDKKQGDANGRDGCPKCRHILD